MNVWRSPAGRENVGISKLSIRDGFTGDGGGGSGVGALNCEKAGPLWKEVASTGEVEKAPGPEPGPQEAPGQAQSLLSPDLMWPGGRGGGCKENQAEAAPAILESRNELLCGKSSRAACCVSGARGQSSQSGSGRDLHHPASSHLTLLSLVPPQGARSDRGPVLLSRLGSKCHSLTSSG